MAKTYTLDLEPANFADVVPGGYQERLEDDRVENDNKNKIDAFAAAMTSSMSMTFFHSGNIRDQMATDNTIFGSFYTNYPIVLKQVVAWATTSGSGGVTTIDLQIEEDPVGAPGIFQTVFIDNTHYKVKLSSSLGDYGRAKVSTFKTGTIPAGTICRFVPLTYAGDATAENAQKNVMVQLIYKPSASYGS